MIFYLTSRIVCSVSAFLYPGYMSYKTLSQRPASEEEIERWLMYWSVLGCIVAVEYTTEWLVSWIPFYYLLKTLFLLYLSLPQTRGSTYLYTYHLQPFFFSHERQIDAAIASLKSSVYTFIQERLRLLWENVARVVTDPNGQANFNPAGGANAGGAPAPPRMGDPVSGPANLVGNLWSFYGPSVIAGGAALLRQGQAAVATAAAASTSSASASTSAANYNSAFISPTTTPPAPRRSDTSQSVLERRRQLEAELAALPPTDSIPMPTAGPSYQTQSRNSSDGNLRGRSASTGKFEEIEVPSDVEGYDTGNGSSGSGGEGRPVGAKRGSSWFGWGSGNEGYEKVKSE